MRFDVDYVRHQFPALDLRISGHAAAFFDAPGGTQTPRRVIDAVSDYLIHKNANSHGAFQTSQDTDRVLLEARLALADFFGCSEDEVAFGDNMTTLNFKLALALARDLQPGDEILITQIDHEANRGPWLALQEQGIIIKEVMMDCDTCIIDLQHFQQQLSDKTKIAAFNYASNAVGTISDVQTMIQWVHQAGGLAVIDAVHYALHGPLDVKALDADFLLCSAYKFFGPHLGVLYGKREVFEKLRTYKVKCQSDQIPYRLETGTLNHEGIAGAAAAIDFIADLGAKYQKDFASKTKQYNGRRKNIISGMLALEDYEMPLAEYLISELCNLPRVKIYGPPPGHPRTSTVSFTVQGIYPRQVAQTLADKGLFVWDGDFYARRLVECLGLTENGGLVRVGLAPYNTSREIERLISEIADLA